MLHCRFFFFFIYQISNDALCFTGGVFRARNSIKINFLDCNMTINDFNSTVTVVDGPVMV